MAGFDFLPWFLDLGGKSTLDKSKHLSTLLMYTSSSKKSTLQIVCFRSFLLLNILLSVSRRGEVFLPFLLPLPTFPALWPSGFS